MDSLSFESLKEPQQQQKQNGHSPTSRRHTVSQGTTPPPSHPPTFPSHVPAKSQAAIEKVAELVSRLGGQIRTHVQDNGDVMLDTYGYKSSAEDTKQFDTLARQIFHDEVGNGDFEALIGQDHQGNLWVYASEEAKLFAESQGASPTGTPVQRPSTPASQPSLSPPAPRSPEKWPLMKALTQISSATSDDGSGAMARADSEPAIPVAKKDEKKDEGYSYAKTLRLTSEQLVPLLPLSPRAAGAAYTPRHPGSLELTVGVESSEFTAWEERFEF